MNYIRDQKSLPYFSYLATNPFPKYPLSKGIVCYRLFYVKVCLKCRPNLDSKEKNYGLNIFSLAWLQVRSVVSISLNFDTTHVSTYGHQQKRVLVSPPKKKEN